MPEVGVRQRRGARRFGWSLISRKGSGAYHLFEENETARTQEFILRWSPDGGSSVKEIVRQQWNFSPPDSVREVEEYNVELSSVTVLELVINPSIGGGVARASVKNLRLS